MLRRDLEQYGNHRIAAAPGTHARIAELVSANVPRDARVLDLGAFTGALIARLRDHGYADLSGADLSNHLTEFVSQFWTADFNGEFASKIGEHAFDCITSCEVIEHLDDPRAFLRECAKLLKPGGTLVISTPNIGFFEGRIKFALTGQIWGFSDRSYASQRHISPIPASHVRLMLDECGFDHVETDTAASFATPLRKALTLPIWAPMRLALGPQVMGETLFFVGRRKADQADRLARGQTPWRAGNQAAQARGEN